jgi:hypothetical protein
MTKWRMTEIVGEAGRLNHIRVQAAESRDCRLVFHDPQEVLGQTSPNLSDLERMRQSVVNRVAVICGRDLRDAGQPSKRG